MVEIALHPRESGKHILVHPRIDEDSPLVKQLGDALYPAQGTLIRRTVDEGAVSSLPVGAPTEPFADPPNRGGVIIDIPSRLVMC